MIPTRRDERFQDFHQVRAFAFRKIVQLGVDEAHAGMGGLDDIQRKV
jgi:hypothetical protein